METFKIEVREFIQNNEIEASSGEAVSKVKAMYKTMFDSEDMWLLK